MLSFFLQYVFHFVAVNQMIDNISERMKGHGDRTSGLLCSMRSSIGKYADIAHKIDDKMHAIYEKMREIVIQVQKNSELIKNTVEPTLLTVETNIRHAKDVVVESLNAQQITVNEQCRLFMQPRLPEHFKEVQNKLKNTLTDKMMKMHNLLENVTINNVSAMENTQKHIESIAASVPSKRNVIANINEIEFIENDLNKQQIRLSEQYTENSSAFNEIAMNTQQMMKNITHEITSCQKKLKFFNEMDFCDYKPTGTLEFLFSKFNLKNPKLLN